LIGLVAVLIQVVAYIVFFSLDVGVVWYAILDG